MARIVGPLLAVVCLFGMLAASAQATQGYQDQASFGVEAFTQPTDLAFDPTTGNLLVIDDPAQSGGRVTVIEDPSGAATPIAEFSPAVVGTPTSIAVDPLTGDVYVDGSAGIARFASDGQVPPTYTLDAGYSPPEGGSGPGQVGNFEAALAVDPTNGDLLVADKGNHRVSRYSPTGAFLESFDGSSGGGGATLTNPIYLAAEPNGNIDVVNLEGSINVFGGVEGTSQISRYNSTGVPIEAIDPTLTQMAVAVAFDPATEDLLFTRQFPGNDEVDTPKLVALHGGAIIQEAPIVAGGYLTSTVPGLTVAPESHIFVLTARSPIFGYGQSSVQRFEQVTFPVVSLNEPSGVTASSAHVSGSVDPDGAQTDFRFEYSADKGKTWQSGPEGGAGEGHGLSPVAGDLTGLEPNLGYLLRLKASNAKAERTSSIRSFQTAAIPPAVITGNVSEPTAPEPELLGGVNPEGAQTQYFFEFGTTTAYGTRTPAHGSLVAGNGRATVSVAAAIAGLVPGSEYHYRIVASNQAGTSLGEDRTFVAGGSEASRAYEMVSPVDKGNVAAATYNESSFARADGNSMLFGTDKASFPGAQAANYIPRNLAVRTSSGWVTKSLDPPSFNEQAGGDFFGVLAISDDQSRALVDSRYALTADATGGESYLYILDIASGTYTLVSPIEKNWVSFQSKEWLMGTTPDLSAVAFLTELPLDPAAAPVRNEYIWREGSGLSLVSREPTGAPFTSSTSTVSEFSHQRNSISQDGSRVYFAIQANEPGAGVYLREDGVTRAISVSHIPGDPKTVVPASLVDASPDGRYAVFVRGSSSNETSAPLTPDAPTGISNPAYLYDAMTGELHYLGAEVNSSMAIAFPALGKLFSTSSSVIGELLYSEDGQTSVIAGPSAAATGVIQASDNGRYLVFEARGDVTGYDSGGSVEIYRFDSVTGDVVCVSCRQEGGKPLGDAGMGQNTGGQSSLDHHFPQAVANDGTVYFDTPDSLVGRDVNGVRDVYEYRNGQDRLVSPGDSSSPALYIEATADGRNVFFVTAQALVPQDKDVLADVYDARIGGGFAAGVDSAVCSNKCRSGASSMPAPVATASELVPGQVPRRKPHRKRRVQSCGKATKARKTKGKSHCHTQKKATAKTNHGGAR